MLGGLPCFGGVQGVSETVYQVGGGHGKTVFKRTNEKAKIKSEKCGGKGSRTRVFGSERSTVLF